MTCDNNAGVPAALAELVTQALDDEVSRPVKPVPISTPVADVGLQGQDPAGAAAEREASPPCQRGLCRCFSWRSRTSHLEKPVQLTAVLPLPAEGAAELPRSASTTSTLVPTDSKAIDELIAAEEAVQAAAAVARPPGPALAEGALPGHVSEEPTAPDTHVAVPGVVDVPEEQSAGNEDADAPAPQQNEPQAAAHVAVEQEQARPTSRKSLAEAESAAYFAVAAAVASAEAAIEQPQLGPQAGTNIGKKTLVLDLDETLVHSSFRVCPEAEIISTVELEGERHSVYVRKRPGVDEFLQECGLHYEVVVYTASVAKYANPLLDKLDSNNVVAHRLFREACTRRPFGYVKDLSKLGRELSQVIIIDNSPTCYAMQPDNAIPIRTWKDDPSDRELLHLIPILQSLAQDSVQNIPEVLRDFGSVNSWAVQPEDAPIVSKISSPDAPIVSKLSSPGLGAEGPRSTAEERAI